MMFHNDIDCVFFYGCQGGFMSGQLLISLGICRMSTMGLRKKLTGG